MSAKPDKDTMKVNILLKPTDDSGEDWMHDLLIDDIRLSSALSGSFEYNVSHIKTTILEEIEARNQMRRGKKVEQ